MLGSEPAAWQALGGHRVDDAAGGVRALAKRARWYRQWGKWLG
jgi:hypothetical protein